MKRRNPSLLFLLLLITVLACVDESSQVGDKWVDSSIRNVLTDTCTVQLSTILADSLTTSGDTICQIGHFSDSYRGAISGSFYTEYQLADISFNDEISYVFDSLTLTFLTTGDYLGDTLTTPQRIHLHRLTETVELIDNKYLYNTSNIRYEDTPLTSFSFRPRPKAKEKFEVRLPDELGEEFFDLMQKQSLSFDSQEHFRQYFPGLAFLPDDNDNCITGFAVNDSSMCITLYYRKIEESATELTATFSPSLTLKFNKATQDFTQTPFEGIQRGTYYAIPSAQSRNIAYLQGLSGLFTKIEFPFLNNLLLQGEMVTIETAILYLYPVQTAYGDQIPLPETLTLYTANSEDTTEGTITDSSGETVQDGSLVKDDLQNLEAYYSFDITTFLQSNLGTFGVNRQKLMLMLPNEKFLTTMEGLILGDMEHDTNNIKLQVLYKIYNP